MESDSWLHKMNCCFRCRKERLSISSFPNLDFLKENILWQVVFKKMQESQSMTDVRSRLECGAKPPKDLAGGWHRKVTTLVASSEQEGVSIVIILKSKHYRKARVFVISFLEVSNGGGSRGRRGFLGNLGEILLILGCVSCLIRIVRETASTQSRNFQMGQHEVICLLSRSHRPPGRRWVRV